MHSQGSPSRTRGLTLLECILLPVLGVMLLAVFVVMPSSVRLRVRDASDQANLGRIHRGLLMHAKSESGRLTTPGLIRRISTGLGAYVPGYGDEDHSQNHTANIFSALIARRFVRPEDVVSVNEVNPRARIKRNYDYSAYEPLQATMWDWTFTAKIDDDVEGSNTSYATLALTGERKSRLWRDRADANTPLVGTRAPQAGVSTGPAYDQSPTLRLVGIPTTWAGHVIFGDHHIERLTSFTRPGTTYKPKAATITQPDNLYDCEFADGAWVHPNHASREAWLAITVPQHAEFRCTPVWDPLLK